MAGTSPTVSTVTFDTPSRTGTQGNPAPAKQQTLVNYKPVQLDAEVIKRFLDDPETATKVFADLQRAIEEVTLGSRSSPIVYGRLLKNVRLNGQLAIMSASSATTASVLMVEDAANFYDGMIIEASAFPYGGPRRLGAVTVAPGGVNTATGQITTTANWTTITGLAEDDYLFESQPNATIGVISAGVGTATITLVTAADAANFFPGQRIQAGATTVYSARRAGAQTVTAVNVGAGTVTGAGTWNVVITGCANGDYLFAKKAIPCTTTLDHYLERTPQGVIVVRTSKGAIGPAIGIKTADESRITLVSNRASLADLYVF